MWFYVYVEYIYILYTHIIVYIYIYRLYVYIYTQPYNSVICIHIYIYTCIRVYIRVCMCIYTYIYIYINDIENISDVDVYLDACRCIWWLQSTYIYIYVCIYEYITYYIYYCSQPRFKQLMTSSQLSGNGFWLDSWLQSADHWWGIDCWIGNLCFLIFSIDLSRDVATHMGWSCTNQMYEWAQHLSRLSPHEKWFWR